MCEVVPRMKRELLLPVVAEVLVDMMRLPEMVLAVMVVDTLVEMVTLEEVFLIVARQVEIKQQADTMVVNLATVQGVVRYWILARAEEDDMVEVRRMIMEEQVALDT